MEEKPKKKPILSVKIDVNKAILNLSDKWIHLKFPIVHKKILELFKDNLNIF